MRKYGVPYKGAKQAIADKIVDTLPPADALVDLFAGGCSITHCALLSGKYKQIIANDINPAGMDLFCRAIAGEYTHESDWISREDFYARKDTDPYISLCWSFGNNERDYLYGRKIEPFKKALHHAIFFEDYTLLEELGIRERLIGDTVQERYLSWRAIAKRLFPNAGTGPENVQSLQNLKRLRDLQKIPSQLESLQRLQNLQNLQNLQYYCLPYQSVPIPDDAVIYCDPPYAQTNGYSKISKDIETLNYEEFYRFCERHKGRIYISEYSMPEDRFECIASFDKQQNMAAKTSKVVKENLYVPK